MKELSEKQAEFLCLISRDKKKSVSELGRTIYATYKSCYDVIYLFQKEGLIELSYNKNSLIPKITLKGEKKVQEIIKKKY
jgi:predicted transcriptional regulator